MSRSRTYRPRVECLESRLVPSTLTVTNLKDNLPANPLIPGSLRQIIDKANMNANLDTIVFKAGLEGTIKLTAGQINIDSNLIIAGPGASRITVDGNAASRIFSIGAPIPTGKNVTIKGLTLFNGKVSSATSSEGGAIRNSVNLTLVKTVIIGNQTNTSGGGLWTAGPQVTIRASRIVGNESAIGGGGVLVAAGTVLIENSTLAGNVAANAALTIGRGGGIRVTGGALTVRNTVVSGNTAGVHGGGLYANSAVTDLSIDKSTITANHAVGQGGGVYTLAVRSILTNTKITSNSAKSSGGGLKSSEMIGLNRCTISGNTSQEGRGGGIRHQDGSFTLINSTVSGNRANQSQGGGIFINNPSIASTIRGCTISGNSATMGGGLHIEAAVSLTIANTTISGNWASSNGGGLFGDNSVLDLWNSTIAFNRAASTGAGISSTGGTIDLVSTIVALNSAAGGNPDLDSTTTAYRASFSLIGDATVAMDANFTDNDDNLFGQDPLLAPLANNGGPTQTHALKKGSPALNQGSNITGEPFDQRGPSFKRKVGAAVDIGAFERQ